MFNKRVVFFCRSFRQRLEPVRIVCHAVFCGPLFHTCCHSIGYLAIKSCAIVNHIDHLLIHVLGQVLIHLFAVKDLLTEILIRSLCGCFYVERLLLECLTDNLKS